MNNLDSVAKVLHFHAVDLCLSPLVTRMNHWWRHEEHLAKIAPSNPMYVACLSISVDYRKLLII